MADQSDQKPLYIRCLPSCITAVTVGCGFVLMVSTALPSISPSACVVATMLGLVADVLDGTLARKLQVKSKFGAFFDQLADLTCFGIGPGIFFVRQRLGQQEVLDFTFPNVLTLLSGYSYCVCSVMRIARELKVHDGVRPLYFVGIPTNLACCLAVPLAAYCPDQAWLPLVIFTLSGMMVMPVKIPKGLGVFTVTETTVTPSS